MGMTVFLVAVSELSGIDELESFLSAAEVMPYCGDALLRCAGRAGGVVAAKRLAFNSMRREILGRASGHRGPGNSSAYLRLLSAA
jgi:hypothetical protein